VNIAAVFDELSSAFPIPVEIDTSALPGELILQPLDQWTAGASLTVPLVVPSAWLDASAGRAQARAAEAQAEAARRTVALGLVRLAWQAGATEAAHAAATHAVEAATAHRDRAARREAAGVGTPLEVLVAETELARRRGDEVGAAADVGRVRRAIGALLGTGGEVRVTLSELAGAEATRPEVEAARWAATAAGRSVDAAWLRHAPTLSASASASASDVAYPTGLKTAWRVGAQLTWVLYDGGARYGALDLARARQDGAEAAAAQVALDTSREAADAAAAVEAADARVVFAAAAVAAADAGEAAAGRAWEAGLVTGVEVLDAVQRRYDAALAHAAAVAAAGVARAEWARATGVSPW
jgi:outer membrane protein TolC